MSNAIHLITKTSEPVADSREIAAGLGLRTKSANVMINRYAEQFRRFGVLAFEMTKPRKASRGGQPERFFLLNEDQCYFLLSLSRNTYRVVGMKADLVAAFGAARRAGAAQAMTVWQELQKLQLEDADSHVRASFGSRLMHDRPRLLPALRERQALLEQQFAPDMFRLTSAA